jgi:rod shape-determining protein MreD
MYIGYLNGKFSYIFYPDDIKLPLTLVAVSDTVYGFMCYLLMFMLRGRFDLPYYFMHVIIPEAVYTTVVTLLFYPIILRINSLLDHDERGSAKKFA